MPEVLMWILISIGSIIGVVLLLFAVMLISKFKVTVSYDEGFSYNVRLLFIKIASSKKKRKKKGKEKKSGDDSESPFDFTLKIVSETIRRFIRHLYFDDIYFSAVTGGDAATAAINYGLVNAAVTPLIGFISSSGHAKKIKVSINPDFTGGKTVFKFRITVSIRGIHGLICLLYIYKNSFVKRKAGQKNERRKTAPHSGSYGNGDEEYQGYG